MTHKTRFSRHISGGAYVVNLLPCCAPAWLDTQSSQVQGYLGGAVFPYSLYKKLDKDETHPKIRRIPMQGRPSQPWV